LTGGPITTTGTVSLADTTVTPGSYTYGAFTVDQQGRLTAASSGTAPVTSISTGTGLTGGPITGSGTISLANTAVTAGSYTLASITVDAQGRITAASSGSAGSGTVTNVATGTGLTGGPITTTGTVSLADTAVTPGSYTYGAFTVDQQGRLTAASSGTAPVTSISTGTGLTGGPITSTGTISLANTAVTAGSYTLASITVDAQGRITAASSGSAGSGTVTNIATGTGLTGGPITTTGTIALANTAVTAGSYTFASITVDAQGRLTAASSGTVTTPSLSYAIIPVSTAYQTSMPSPSGRYNVTWDTAIYDPHGIRTSSTVLTIPSTGLWEIRFGMSYGFFASTDCTQYYYRNGGIIATRGMPDVTGECYINDIVFSTLTAGDVIHVEFSSAGSGATSTPRYSANDNIVLIQLSA